MNLSELYKKLNLLDIPVFYRVSNKKANPPYIAYYCNSENHRGSDFSNEITEGEIFIELYTKGKDIKLEKNLEEILSFTHFEKEEYLISDEKTFMIVYSYNFITKEK